MITTLTLNPCIDKTITVNAFNYGGLNRIINTRTDFSGKGINVSIAVHQLGEKTECIGFNFKDGGVSIHESLDRSGITHNFIEVEGTLRTNIKVFDQQKRVMTELNESGQFVKEEAVALLKKIVYECAKDTGIVVFSGSVPEGVPKDIYKSLIEMIKDNGLKTVLDAEGELLLEGIKAGPFLVKPNLFELETAFHVKINDKKDIVRIARGIIEKGIEIVCVSMGKDGAVIISRDEAWFSSGVDIKVKGVQGAGDSLVAGICIAMKRKLAIPEMLRYGVAAASASLLREGTLLCTREDFEKMLSMVTIEKINI